MELWKACAGPLVDVPKSGERVFYFPQGHMEQVSVFFVFWDQVLFVLPESFCLSRKSQNGWVFFFLFFFVLVLNV